MTRLVFGGYDSIGQRHRRYVEELEQLARDVDDYLRLADAGLDLEHAVTKMREQLEHAAKAALLEERSTPR